MPVYGASGGSAANIPTLYFGQVSTNCKPARNLMSAGAGRWQRTRSTHIARDALSNPTAIFGNFRISGNAEAVQGAGTIRAWLEYPAGTYTEANECIAGGGQIAFPNGLTSLTFNATVPKGAVHYFVVIQQNDNGTNFFQYQHNDNALPGEGWQTGTTGMPTTPSGTPADVLSYHPLAVLSMTRQPSFILEGDSREEGSDQIDDVWENGQTRPSLGRQYAYINLAISAQTLAGRNTGPHTYRDQLFKYVTDVVNNYGVNDIGTGGTVDALVTSFQTYVTNTVPLAGTQGLRFWTATIPPYTGTTDGNQTIANQTASGTNNIKVNDWNYRVRTGAVSPVLSGFFDIAAAIDSYRLGKWPVSRNPFAASYENVGVVFTASQAGDTLTVTAVSSGTIKEGDPLLTALNGSAPNTPRPGTRIRPFGTGGSTGTGTTGTYKLTRFPTGQSTIASTTFYVGGLWTNDNLHMTDVGRDAIRLSGIVNPVMLVR